MAEVLDLGADDGLVLVKFGDAEVEIDLVGAWERYCAHRNENEGRTDYTDSLVEFMIGLGLPRCSQRVALRFINRLSELIEALKKSDLPAVFPGETSPNSPASTASTSAA